MNRILDISPNKELGVEVPLISLDGYGEHFDVYRLYRIEGTNAVYVPTGILIESLDELKELIARGAPRMR